MSKWVTRKVMTPSVPVEADAPSSLHPSGASRRPGAQSGRPCRSRHAGGSEGRAPRPSGAHPCAAPPGSHSDGDRPAAAGRSNRSGSAGRCTGPATGRRTPSHPRGSPGLFATGDRGPQLDLVQRYSCRPPSRTGVHRAGPGSGSLELTSQLLSLIRGQVEIEPKRPAGGIDIHRGIATDTPIAIAIDPQRAAQVFLFGVAHTAVVQGGLFFLPVVATSIDHWGQMGF